MRSGGASLLILGFALGLTAGWLVFGFAKKDAPAPPIWEGRAPSAEQPAGPIGPRLHAPPGARSDASPRDPDQPRARLTEEGARELRVLEPQDPEDGEVGTKGLPALAMLYALAGREEDFLRVAERALALGVDFTLLHAAFQELPPESRVAALDTLLERHGTIPLLPYDLAKLYGDAGATDRALAVVREALTGADATHGPLLQYLFELDPSGAASYLLSLPEPGAWPGDQLQMLNAALAASGREREIVPLLLARLELHPEDASALQQLAALDPASGLGYARVRVGENPEDVEAWALLGRMELQAGNRAAAFEALREAASRSPQSQYLDALRMADPVAAIPVIEELVAGSTDDEALGTLAKAYEDAGRTDAAMETFLRALEIDPTDGEWLSHVTQIDPDRALALLRERLGPSVDANNDELIGDLADALRATGRNDEAFEHYLRANELDPSDPEWQTGLVSVDAERALPILERRLREGPSQAATRGALGRAYAALGRERDAVDAFERAIDEGAAEYVTDLAQIAPERALSRLRMAVERQPDNDELWGDLGDLLAQLGETAEARRAYQKARQLDPGDTEWITALARTR